MHDVPFQLDIDCTCSYADEWHAGYDLVDFLDSVVPLLFGLKLSFIIPEHYTDVMDDALEVAAPNLRAFTLITEYPVYIPLGLFGGHAPRLKTLALGSRLQLDSEIPAFANVRDLTLELDDIASHPPLVLLFPSLKRLSIYRASPGVDAGIAPSFGGLRLDLLRMEVLEEDNALLSHMQTQMAFSEITHVCLYGVDWPSDPAILDGMTGVIDVRVHGFENWSEMTVFFPDVQRWRTAWFEILWEPEDDYHPLQDFPGLASHLRSLRLDLIHLHGLWAAAPSLPLLRFLQLDMPDDAPAAGTRTFHSRYYDSYVEGSPKHANMNSSTPVFDDESPWVLCGALEQIRIVAAQPAPVAIESRELALLGLGLGQRNRERHVRAKLVLVGLAFTDSVQQDLLDQVFSTVELREFVGYDFDGDRWNVCLDKDESAIPWQSRDLYSYSPFVYSR